jgi:hypothetical protein
MTNKLIFGAVMTLAVAAPIAAWLIDLADSF